MLLYLTGRGGGTTAMFTRTAWILALALCLGRAQAQSPAPGTASGPPQPLDALPYVPGLDVSAMDRSTNACVDFYRYSCGGWIRSNPIPQDQGSWSVYEKLYEANQQFLWGILQALASEATDRSADQQRIGDYFASCMDESAADRSGTAPLLSILAQINDMNSVADLPLLLARMHSELGGAGFLFEMTASQDLENSEQMIPFANAGGLGMPDRDYYTDTDAHTVKLRRLYQQHVARTLELLGESHTSAQAEAGTILRMETELARASLTRVEQRDPHNLFHKMSLESLNGLTPRFAWIPYLDAQGLSGTASVNVSEPAFYRALDHMLANTALADLKAYLRWHAAHAAAPYLSHALEDERFRFFDQQLRGIPQQRPRWKRCVREVDLLIGEALGKEFVARVFGPPLKEATLRMARQIETAMREDILALAWMSEPTKQRALEKLGAITNKIGYPERWRDYGTLRIVRGDRLGNFERAMVFERQRELARIGKPLDRTEWGMTPQTVNAYYDPQMNDINFPAGILQPPLYDPRMDDAPNYGNTGGTIGHELTHAFDDEGRQFDARGNLQDWWSAEDASQFAERTRCIVNQYGQYVVVDNVHINSRLTLGEDIADLGGLILARMAWRVQIEGQSLPATRDGLTPEQRFFVGYAQWACESERPETLRLHAKTDAHSPARYRVNGVVANMPEFRQAFMCPAHAPMVNAVPCRVW